jgi:hypothetical protein
MNTLCGWLLLRITLELMLLRCRRWCMGYYDFYEFFVFSFLEGLEGKIPWIHDFRNPLDGLLHQYCHFVFATTKEGDLGYDIMDRKKVFLWNKNCERCFRRIAKHN